MFSEKALIDQEPLIMIYVDKLISRLHEQAGRAGIARVDLVRWYNYVTFDVCSQVLLLDLLLRDLLPLFLAHGFYVGPWQC